MEQVWNAGTYLFELNITLLFNIFHKDPFPMIVIYFEVTLTLTHCQRSLISVGSMPNITINSINLEFFSNPKLHSIRFKIYRSKCWGRYCEEFYEEVILTVPLLFNFIFLLNLQ